MGERGGPPPSCNPSPCTAPCASRDDRALDQIALVDDRQARVVMEMNPENYHLAVTAHDQGKTVRALGKLIKEGRGCQLQEAREFAVDEE
jgi:hypothetical protein